jgi:hypothetical protein
LYLAGSRRKFHNEEPHSWYPPQNLISVTKSRMMRWTGYAAHTEDEKFIRNINGKT